MFRQSLLRRAAQKTGLKAVADIGLALGVMQLTQVMSQPARRFRILGIIQQLANLARNSARLYLPFGQRASAILAEDRD